MMRYGAQVHTVRITVPRPGARTVIEPVLSRFLKAYPEVTLEVTIDSALTDIVRERSLLRQLIRAGNEIAAAAFKSEGETARELVDRAEQRVFEIAEGSFRRREGEKYAGLRILR